MAQSRELFYNLRNSIKNRRILEMASVATIEINGELVPIKSRYTLEKTKQILAQKDEFVIALDTDKGDEIDKFFAKHVIVNQLLSNEGVKTLEKLRANE